MKQNKNSGVTSKDTWTVRGVPHEARTAALVASRKAGVTVGEWVTRAVQEHAKTAVAVPAQSNEDVLAAIFTQLEKRDQAMHDLAAKVEAMQARGFLRRLFGG